MNGTNVSGAGLQAALREAGNQLQAIILISDGQSNVGSSETFRELQARAANPKARIHLITVGVGAYREPVGIRLQDLPNLTKELLKRGYSESDIDKILGGNMLRVMEEVEKK